MVEIINLTRQKVNQKLLVKKAEQVLRAEKAKNWDISICLVGCAKIKELNKRFRKQDKTTDVLSFGGLENIAGKNKLGQIVICPAVVKARQKFGKSFQAEMEFAVVHSVLHLLGYEHEKSQRDAERMRSREQKYIKI